MTLGTYSRRGTKIGATIAESELVATLHWSERFSAGGHLIGDAGEQDSPASVTDPGADGITPPRQLLSSEGPLVQV
jgi:hypothetical protein